MIYTIIETVFLMPHATTLGSNEDEKNKKKNVPPNQ